MQVTTATRVRIDRILETRPVEERSRLRERFDRLEAACGCGAGAVFMLLGTVAAVTQVLTGSSMNGMPSGAFVVLALFTSAVVGKVSGLTVAQVRLRWVLHKAERAG
jgi:hypothetical protein